MLRMKDGETIKEYSSKLLQLVNQIRLYGEAFEDSKVVEKMLISLPNRFESKISAIEESCDLKHLSVAVLISKLQAQEQRTSMRLEETIEGALVLKHKYKKNGGKKSAGDKESNERAFTEPEKKGKFPPYGTCKRANHLEKDCFYKGKPQYQCRFCNKYGYIERYCRLKMDQYKQQHVEQANMVDNQPQPEEYLFMAISSP